MRITTLILSLVFSSTFVQAQTTFDLDWEQGVNGSSASFTVEIGDSVHWTWANGSPHSVTSEAGSTETFDSGIITGSGTEFTYTFLEEGSNPYVCVVHMGSMFGTITVEPTLSIQDKFERNLNFYPNPVEEEMTIASLYQFDTYEIYDISGKKVGTGLGEGTFTSLNTSYLSPGTYFVKVYADNLQATLTMIKR